MIAPRLVPSPEARVLGDIRGVVLGDGVNERRVEFFEVSRVRWTSSALVTTGAVDYPGRAGRRPVEKISFSFPLDDISYVLVREFSPGKSFWQSVGGGLAVGALAGLVLVF